MRQGALQSDDVKATGWRAGEAQQINKAGMDDTLLFVDIDTGQCAPEVGVSAVTDFDKNQGVVNILHDQIDLAALAAKMRHQQTQAPGLQVALGHGFGLLAVGVGGVQERVLMNDKNTAWQHAAELAAGTQNYPQSCLYVVATPIGNLSDISLRALYILSKVDVVACEDTRNSGHLLHHFGLSKSLLAVHEHNEASACAQVVQLLQQGQRVAYISDAGTPAVSDPGARLVAGVRAAGLRVMPVPGPSSVTTALSVAGLVAGREDESSFSFVGFLSAKAQERARQVRDLPPHAVVLFESPHRIAALIQALAEQYPQRVVTVCRELSKQFEAIDTLSLAQAPEWLNQDEHRSRGEFVLVLHPLASSAQAGEAAVEDVGLTQVQVSVQALMDSLLPALPLKQAVQMAVTLTGLPRNALYEKALAWKAERA